MWNKQHFFGKSYSKRDKKNAGFWKNIQNKVYLAQFSKLCLSQQLFAFKEFWMETRFSYIFKTANVMKLTRAILENSYRVQQATSKWKTLDRSIYFLRTVEVWATFDVQISITLAIFWEKLQNYT